MKPIYAQSSNGSQSYVRCLVTKRTYPYNDPASLSEALAALEVDQSRHVAEFEKRMGRTLSREELVNGPAKQSRLTPAEKAELETRKRLAAPPPEPENPYEKILAAELAKQPLSRVDQLRQKSAEWTRAREAERLAAREAQQPARIRAVGLARETLLHARFNPDLYQEDIEALEANLQRAINDDDLSEFKKSHNQFVAAEKSRLDQRLAVYDGQLNDLRAKRRQAELGYFDPEPAPAPAPAEPYVPILPMSQADRDGLAKTAAEELMRERS